MERASRNRNRKSNKARKAPKVPIKTYRWEDIRRARRKGGYPWTYLYKRPFNDKMDPYPFTMDALRRSKSASTMGARSDGVDISEISSFAESGKTTPSFLHAEYMTETPEDISAKHSRAGSEVIEEYVENGEKDFEDDVQIKEFRRGSADSSDNISQYLDKEERGPDNSNTNEDSGIENDKKEDSTANKDTRSQSDEAGNRKRKLSAESSYSRYSLSKLGVMKKLRDAKSKINDAKNKLTDATTKISKDAKSKIKVPKLSFPTKKSMRKRISPPKDVKKEEKSKKGIKKEQKTTLETSKLRKTDKPVYIHIPLKPPPGETDEFSYLEFEPEKANDQNELNEKSDAAKSDNVTDIITEEKLALKEETEPVEDEKIDGEDAKSKLILKDDNSKDNKQDTTERDKNRNNSPFSSLERGPRVTKKPPLKINPAFKQFLKDVRQLKDKEMEDGSNATEGGIENKAFEDISKTEDTSVETTPKSKSSPKLDKEEYLDLEEQQTSDSESQKEDAFDKLFEASASKKHLAASKQSKKDNGDQSSSSRNVRSRSAEPERKRKSSIDSSYSRKSLSKLGIIKKLKEASEKIKGAFSLSSLKRSDSKKEKEPQEKPKKENEKEIKIKKHKPTAQEKLSQLDKPKQVVPEYIHIPLKPPPGVIDEFSHLEEETKVADALESKKEERTDSLDSMSPISTKDDAVQFIFLTPPSDDEILDDKEHDIPETPTSEDSPVFFGSLKKLAERVVDQISPETKKKTLDTVSEENDKGSSGEVELTGRKVVVEEIAPLNKEEIETPVTEGSEIELKTEEKEESSIHKSDEITEPDDAIKPGKMIVDVEDGLNEPPKTDELKSVLKSSSSENTSPVLKKKVSFRRKTRPAKTKTDADNGYEPIEVPKEDKTVNLLEQAGILTEKTDIEGEKDANEDIKESILTKIDEDKKKLLVGDLNESMSVDDEKGYLDQKIVKDTSLEEDYNKWSKSGDHEYEPINPPDEVTLMTSSILPGITVIDSDNEPKVVISATEILDKPMEEKKKSFFQFGRFNREKAQSGVEKDGVHGGSSDDRSRSSQGREIPEIDEQPRPIEGPPNKFQVAFKQRTDQLRSKTNELRNKVRNIKKPNIHMPKAPEFKKPEFKKPSFKKPEFKKPDFKKFKFEKPKINLHLPKIPDTATIHLPNISLPGAKKVTETRTVETRQYSTESNAGDSGSTKRSKFDFDFSKTFPRFKKKKATDDQNVTFGTTPRAKKNKDVENRTTEGSGSSIRIPLHSEDSLDADERLNFSTEHEPVRAGYEDRETSEDIDRSSRMRFDNDIGIEDEYERENQEINRAEYLNRWQHGNARPLGRYEDDEDDFSHEDERIVEQLVEQRFQKVGPGYGEGKQPHEPNYERYEDNQSETLEDRLRRDEDRPRYSDDEEEFSRRLKQNKDLITDLDNLEEDETGVHIGDGYSSEGSVNLQNKGRLGKLDINSDEFFVVHEIREGFQTPANALAQMNEYDPIGSNRSLPQAPPSKRKPIKKPKRKKTPHVSQEEIPGDEESVDGIRLPSRPKRKSKKNKKKPDDDDVVPYQKTIHLEYEESPIGERLNFPRESLGILGDDERDDHEFEMYENEKMKGKEQPEIRVTDPYKEFQIREQQIIGQEEARIKSTEPSAPPRRHRSLKSLTQSENESILTDRFEDQNSGQINIEDYIIPAHQIEAAPRRPSRRSRSHTSSLSRVSLPPSQRDTDSLLADDAFFADSQPIPSYLIENQSYVQQYKDNQASAPAYFQEEQPMQPCVEEPCFQDLRDYMGYSIVDKSKQREPPLPPPRTPPRRKRQIDPEQKFATVPRHVGSSQPASPPVRPLRNYSTLSQVKSSTKDSSQYENDKENRGHEIDIGQYIEVDEDLNRDLISGEIVQKMRQRPLPAPPRPPRKSKTTRRSLQDITSKENIMPLSSSPQDIKPSYIEEETVSTQTEPLPPDFVCEEIHQEPTDKIITPRVNEKVEEASSQKSDIAEPKTQNIERNEPLIRRELITPSVYSYEETVTHASLLVEPLNGAKVVPDHQLSRERLVPVTKEYSDEETSEVPESFHALKNPEETRKSRVDHQKPLDVLRTDKLQVSDLDVDRLRVNELLASKIVVSEIDSSIISTNEIQSKSGSLKVGEIELPTRFLEQIVKKLEEIRPSETSSGERSQEVSREEKKTSILEESSQSLQTSNQQQPIIESQIDVDPSSSSLASSLPFVEPLLSSLNHSLSTVHHSVDGRDHLERLARIDRLEDQYSSTADPERELSPEPPVPPPRSYNLEETPPDAPPRTLRRKSKDSPRTIDTQWIAQSDTNANPEKTDHHSVIPELPQEMLEPDIDDEPPPRPPEPLEGLYMPSQPPASFYALKAKQYVGLENENIPTVPRRKRHQKNRSRPVSRSRSTSDDSSVTPSHLHTRSPRPTRRFSESSIPELSGRLIQACGSRINNSLKRLIYYLTENILRNADGNQDLHVFMIILLVLIAGLILLGYGEDKTVVHLHHWEYFNPPKDL